MKDQAAMEVIALDGRK